MDQGGGLHVFDPALYQKRKLNQWQSGGKHIEKADTLEENPRFPPVLLADDKGETVWQVACPSRGDAVVLREVGWTAGGDRLELKWEKTVNLWPKPDRPGDKPPVRPPTLAGLPARLGKWLLLPLDNGVLGRVSLARDGDQMIDAFNWRAKRLGPETPGHVLALGGDRFLTADGAYGVTCWSWPAGPAAPWSQLPPREVAPRKEPPPTLPLKERLAGRMLRVPSDDPKHPYVCLADVRGRLTLYRLQPDGGLRETRRWDLKGRITADPFLPPSREGKSAWAAWWTAAGWCGWTRNRTGRSGSTVRRATSWWARRSWSRGCWCWRTSRADSRPWTPRRESRAGRATRCAATSLRWSARWPSGPATPSPPSATAPCSCCPPLRRRSPEPDAR